MHEITRLDKNIFIQDLSSNSILLFIHGFNVSFEDAALRTAQLNKDLKFKGQSFFFSWASSGGSSGYVNDAEKINASSTDIAEFIELLSQPERVDSIFMIGHSMGSRGLASALASIKEKINPIAQKKLRELILVQPDISQSIFKNKLAPKLKELGARVSVYASKSDKALGASKMVNKGATRLGQGGENIYKSEIFDIIDASNIGISFFSLNHSEYAENTIFLKELKSVLAGTPIDQRVGIRKADGHWVFDK